MILEAHPSQQVLGLHQLLGCVGSVLREIPRTCSSCRNDTSDALSPISRPPPPSPWPLPFPLSASRSVTTSDASLRAITWHLPFCGQLSYLACCLCRPSVDEWINAVRTMEYHCAMKRTEILPLATMVITSSAHEISFPTTPPSSYSPLDTQIRDMPPARNPPPLP